MDIKELHSFKLSDAVKFQDKLNPKLFLGNRLDPAVKNQLITIAKDFLTELGVGDVKVKDITISGSNAAFTYTSHSDLDLHIVVDYNQFSNDSVYKELFNAKKNLYNDSHNITIRGIPVEVYMEDSNEPVISVGEYSILNDKWKQIPTKRRANFDQTATKAKFGKLQDFILRALKEKNVKKITKALKIIKRYRQAGLDTGGEFSPENLAYKALRSQGAITKLYNLRDELHSKQLSIENMYAEQKLDIPTYSIPQLAKKHNVSEIDLMDQLMMGINVELEHTNDEDTAREIALDHLGENPHYYTKLKQANLEEYVDWKTLDRDFKKEKIVGNLLLKAEGGSLGRLHIKAYDISKGSPVDAGFADFSIRSTPEGEDYLRASYTYVNPPYRSKGIAKQMYIFVNEIGNDIKPSELQTDLGKGMWKGLEKVVKQPSGIKPQPKPEKKLSALDRFKNFFKKPITTEEKIDEDIPVQKGPAISTRKRELKKTQDELGSGFFGTVYDEPESKTGVGTARKVSTLDRDEMTADGYYAYINKIMDLKNETNNPYLPQVYDAKVVKPKSVGSEPYFELELEKLSKWEDLSGNQLEAILEKMLDESFENKKKLQDVLKFLGHSGASDTIDEWLMFIILYFIRFTIKNPNFSLMGMKIRDPQLLEVTDMLRYLSKSGYGMDLHDQNIMVRNTKYGPQLVITDPLSFGQTSQIRKFKQGNMKMDVRGVTIPPNYIIYDIHDKDRPVLRGYGSYEEIYQQFIELKNKKPYNDYEIAPMNQKASDEMDAKQASVKAKYKEKPPANPKYQLKPKHTYAVYDKDKTSNMLIGYVNANHDSEALGLARKKFPDVKNIVVLPDLLGLGDPNDKFAGMLEEALGESASGYIPSKKQANDPRFKTALTVDIKPDSIQKNAKAFGFKVKRSGIPPLLRP